MLEITRGYNQSFKLSSLTEVREDVLSFGAAISACAHSHHWRSAVHLLKLNAADVVGYNGAVDACAKAVVTLQILQLDIVPCIYMYIHAW